MNAVGAEAVAVSVVEVRRGVIGSCPLIERQLPASCSRVAVAIVARGDDHVPRPAAPSPAAVGPFVPRRGRRTRVPLIVPVRWILSCRSMTDWINCSGRGGQPGTYTSTGMKRSMPCTTA